MNQNWDDILVAFLHDPPDKALSIRGHEQRARRYLAVATGREVARDEIHGTEDQLASVAERLPSPTAGAGGERAVEPSDGKLDVRHPLSGTHDSLAVGRLEEAIVEDKLRQIASTCGDSRSRFLALWRLLPDMLADQHPWFDRLPADTRVPDHTIWHHLNTTAGLKPAIQGRHGAALLSYSLGPVQPFIEAARSVRDLWSGSMILSWLTFQAMLPVIERYGPTAIVYPSLHGTPLLDLWLRREVSLQVPMPDKDSRKAPCLPNRFLAVVPSEPDVPPGESLADLGIARARAAWKKLTDGVRRRLKTALDERAISYDGWDKRWDRQVEDYFEMRTVVVPLRECGDETLARLAGHDHFDQAFPQVAAVRRLAEAIPEADRPGYQQNSAGRWQEQVDLTARAMAAQRSVRHVPHSTVGERVPPKCSLFGTFEQMGPDTMQQSRAFWDEAASAFEWSGVRLRPREAFCALALTKRFAVPALLARELELERESLRFPDTATVAAADWLSRAREKGIPLDPEQIREVHRDWSGQWLHWPHQDFGKDENRIPDEVWKSIQQARREIGRSPAYFAVLMMDGDEMGRWLAGELSPSVRDILHPKLREYFDRLPGTEAGLESRRPLGPARHAAMSQALANFALHVVPAVVKRHHGTLIYAGGDDVLALLPLRSALACAAELRMAFSGDGAANNGAPVGYYRWKGRDLLMMGPKATASTGLAVVHYKEDLRSALQAARSAEKSAKDSGRDILQVATSRRSGEHASVLCPWEQVDEVCGWVEAFVQGASDRWAYHLRQDLDTLESLPVEAARAEIIRQMQRSAPETRALFRGSEGQSAGERLAAAFDRYHATLTSDRRKLGNSRALHDFIILCQTASFLARGEEER